VLCGTVFFCCCYFVITVTWVIFVSYCVCGECVTNTHTNTHTQADSPTEDAVCMKELHRSSDMRAVTHSEAANTTPNFREVPDTVSMRPAAMDDRPQHEMPVCLSIAVLHQHKH
jgi:hypothetical protein